MPVHSVFAPCFCLPGRQSGSAGSGLSNRRSTTSSATAPPPKQKASPPALDTHSIASRQPWNCWSPPAKVDRTPPVIFVFFSFLDFFFARLSSAMMTSKIFALAKDRHGPLEPRTSNQQPATSSQQSAMSNHERRLDQGHTRDASLSERPSHFWRCQPPRPSAQGARFDQHFQILAFLLQSHPGRPANADVNARGVAHLALAMLCAVRCVARRAADEQSSTCTPSPKANEPVATATRHRGGQC